MVDLFGDARPERKDGSGGDARLPLHRTRRGRDAPDAALHARRQDRSRLRQAAMVAWRHRPDHHDLLDPHQHRNGPCLHLLPVLSTSTAPRAARPMSHGERSSYL